MRFTCLALLPALTGCIVENDSEDLSAVESELPIIDPCWWETPRNVMVNDIGPNQRIATAELPFFVSSSCQFAVFETEIDAVVPTLYTVVRPSPLRVTPAQCVESTSWERTYYKTSPQIFGYVGGAVETRRGMWDITNDRCVWVVDGSFETRIPAGYIHKIRIHGVAYIGGAPTTTALKYGPAKMTF